MARTIPSNPSASALHGLWFVFHHAGHHFGLWISSLTGKEELYLNGALVAERRKIALSSVHELVVDGSNYSLGLSTRNLRRGVFECELRENGVPVAALATEYVARRRWQQSVATIAGAAFVVYVALKADAPFLLTALGVAAVATLSYAWLGRGSGYVIRPIQSAVTPKER